MCKSREARKEWHSQRVVSINLVSTQDSRKAVLEMEAGKVDSKSQRPWCYAFAHLAYA